VGVPDRLKRASPRVDAVVVDDPVSRETQTRREALFASIVSAFSRRDFAAMEAVLSEEPVLMFAGSSELAGTYRGVEGIDRYLLAIRDLVRPNGKTIAYTHRDDEMVASHEICVFGLSGTVDMTMHITLTFDRDKVAVVFVRPEDTEVFDRVLAPPASLTST
jgi:ketosteroid isomerase-like protein